jgi:hypothetical protein
LDDEQASINLRVIFLRQPRFAPSITLDIEVRHSGAHRAA